MQREKHGRLWRYGGSVVLLLVFACASLRLDAQLSHSRGQNVAPSYEGWELNGDGSYNLVFGYMNRNWDEEIDVPIGPENSIEPGGPDQGQPTRFLPRRNRFVFRVRVPADFKGDKEKEVVWTLTTHGKTERAYATLRPDYFMDNNVIASNIGAAPGGSNLELQNLNKAPKLRVDGDPTRSITVGQSVTLTAFASDDGIPKVFSLPPHNPLRGTGGAMGSATGLRVAWFVYRGAGKVTFDPPQFKVYEDSRSDSPWAPGWIAPPIPADGKWVVRAAFSEPGTYTLRCLAHDGHLMTPSDVVVTVREALRSDGR